MTAEISSCGWYRQLLESPDWEELESYGRIRDPSHHQFPTHFVMGSMSPFCFARFRHTSQPAERWAVYFGEYTQNGLGVGQGGAIAAVFDYAMACAAAALKGRSAPTKTLQVRYRRPLQPVPGCYCLDLVLEHPCHPREFSVTATLRDQPESLTSNIFCSATASFVDVTVPRNDMPITSPVTRDSPTTVASIAASSRREAVQEADTAALHQETLKIPARL